MNTKQPLDDLKIKDITPEHLQAIGEFVVAYNLLEATVHLVFANYSNIPVETGRAIIGGMRLKDVIERIKRLMKINGNEKAQIDNFEYVEQLLNPISTFRDKIVHRTWLPTENGPALINIAGAKGKASLIVEPVSTEEINQNIVKLAKLSAVLMAHALGGTTWVKLSAAEQKEINEAFQQISLSLSLPK